MTTHRLTREELDAQFDKFLKESVSDDSLDLGGHDTQNKTRQEAAEKPAASWWRDEEDRGGGERETTKQRFLKAKKSFPEKNEGSGESLRKTPSIQEEDEGPGGSQDEGLDAAFLADYSAGAAAANRSGLGLDTLEEESEKARFFAQLEDGAASTIDYSKLNRELDSTASTPPTNTRTEPSVKRSEEGRRKAGVPDSSRASPDSPHYSEDFEDEEEDDAPDEKAELSPVLARVSLYDSLEDAAGDRRKDAPASLDKGLSYEQSGGSEMEALQEAYRHIHVVADSSVEDRERIHRAASPSSSPPPPPPPPQRARLSLQRASTNDSDLPTAEELMKLLRPEDAEVRGFSLQPASAAGLDDESMAGSPRRTSPPGSPSPCPERRRGAEGAAAGRRGTEGGTSGHTPPDPPAAQRTQSLREEVGRLMKDHKSSSASPPAGRAKKLPASSSSAGPRSSVPVVRKPSVPPGRGRGPERGRAATSRTPGTSRATATVKTQSPVAPRSLQQPQPTTSSRSQQQGDSAEAAVRMSSELVASVQSLVAVLQQRVETSAAPLSLSRGGELRALQGGELRALQGGELRALQGGELRALQGGELRALQGGELRALQGGELRALQGGELRALQGGELSSVVEDLRVQLALKESELQRMKEGVLELNSLRQQNFLLHSKLRSAEERRQTPRTEASDPATAETLQQMEREIAEQENLIKGYQQENEKLYLQMKTQRVKSKCNEEFMFQENQRLLTELESTRQQLKKSWRPAGGVCLTDHTQRINDLLAQIHSLQRNEAKLTEEVCSLQAEKRSLEVELQLVKKERDQIKSKEVSTSGVECFGLHVAERQHQEEERQHQEEERQHQEEERQHQEEERQHQEEVSCLKKKLQWFTENQELQDRDAGRLKAATAEIQQLKEEVKNLKQEASRRSEEQQRKSWVRSVETERLQELQKQVKELEHILRTRNPNSLPALIYAAASAECDRTSPSSSRTTALLERRIRRLEGELEGHEDEAKSSLKALEQQLHRMKMSYEQQVCELEQKLEARQQEALDSQVVKVQGAEEELQLRQNQRQEDGGLEEAESLQLRHKAPPPPGRRQRQAEVEFGVRLARLKQELIAKTRSNQELTRTVDRLQKERRNFLSGSNRPPEPRHVESRRQPGDAKPTGQDAFPPAHPDKTYQATVFTGSHSSEVLEENERLKQRLETETEALKAENQQIKEELSRLTESSAEQLSSIEAQHAVVVDRLRAQHALQHSSSTVAELTRRLSSQQIVIQHLREQASELQGTKEALEVSRTREGALQTQLAQLLQDLKEARDTRSPQRKLLWSLKRKISHMELRHQQREAELTQVMGGAQQMLGAEPECEVERWRRVAWQKSREVESFQLELDSILAILRQLQTGEDGLQTR